jgi:hypothetical protein
MAIAALVAGTVITVAHVLSTMGAWVTITAEGIWLVID